MAGKELTARDRLIKLLHRPKYMPPASPEKIRAATFAVLYEDFALRRAKVQA